MKHESRLESSAESTSEQSHVSASGLQGVAFATPEDMLRQDRDTVQVPGAVEERLRQSIAAEPPPPKAAWWKRWLGGGRE